MRFYRCDRCGEEYTDWNHITTEELGLTGDHLVSNLVNFPFDLCDKCRSDFIDWFRQPKADQAFEMALMGVNDHSENSVSVIGMSDGRVICPVCGQVYHDVGTECTSCHTKFTGSVTYVKVNTKDGDENDVTD